MRDTTKLDILIEQIEKTAFSDEGKVMATGLLSPVASGLAAEEGKGLQTSAAGLAGSLLGKKIFKSNALARLLGAGSATAATSVGDGLVAPSEEVLEDMRRRGEFSKWDYAKGALRGTAMGAGFGLAGASGIGFLPALALPMAGSMVGTAAGIGAGAGALGTGAALAGGGATLGGALTGAAAGAGRGLLGGTVISPSIRAGIKKFHELKAERAKQENPTPLSPDVAEQAMRLAERPGVDKTIDQLRDKIL